MVHCRDQEPPPAGTHSARAHVQFAAVLAISAAIESSIGQEVVHARCRLPLKLGLSTRLLTEVAAYRRWIVGIAIAIKSTTSSSSHLIGPTSRADAPRAY